MDITQNELNPDRSQAPHTKMSALCSVDVIQHSIHDDIAGPTATTYYMKNSMLEPLINKDETCTDDNYTSQYIHAQNENEVVQPPYPYPNFLAIRQGSEICQRC